MKTKIITSAPGKLMLFGEHAVVYDKPCIVTAVDQRMVAEVEKIDKKIILINAPDVKVTDYSFNLSSLRDRNFPKEVRFVLTTVINFFEKYNVKSGLNIKTKSEFSSLYGFGSSSAVTVCVTSALAKIFDIKISNKELFDLSYKTVLDVQGVGSGFDLAAAIWGGTLYFIKGGKNITPLISEELPIVVGYTGIKADTTTLVNQVVNLYKSDQSTYGKIFDSIEIIVNESKAALVNADYQKLGQLMNENQALLRNLNVSSKELDILTQASRNAGAYGAKLSGAGGGDCMIAITNDRSKIAVANEISRKGGQIINVKTGAQGIRIENNKN